MREEKGTCQLLPNILLTKVLEAALILRGVPAQVGACLLPKDPGNVSETAIITKDCVIS